MLCVTSSKNGVQHIDGHAAAIRAVLLQVMSLSSNDRDQLLSQKADEIEKELELLGVTGIEDRLQVCSTH